MRWIGWLIAVVLAGLLGLMAYVRLAPTDPALWNVDISKAPGVDWSAVSAGQVTVLPNGGLAILPGSPDQASANLAKLDAVALATPRTIRIAGSVEEGRITWETRSRLWGFPDYTTAQTGEDGTVKIFARQRFGGKDMGVNAARLKDWLARL